MVAQKTQTTNADTEDRAYELCLMLNNISGVDDVGYYPDGEGTTVSLWVPSGSADSACDMAGSKGFTEGYIDQKSEDGSQLRLSFSQ